jgi:hypothetical protein
MKLGNPTLTRDAFAPPAHVRDAIVAALATVPDLTAHRTAPDQPQPFDAWPRWSTSAYTGGRLDYLAVHEYDAVICLPAAYEPDTVEAGDSLLSLVVAALWPVGKVETAEPVRLTFENGSATPALRVHLIPHLNPLNITT